MNHPFALNLSDLEAVDLEFEEYLTDEEATQVGGGGGRLTTYIYGEEGGYSWGLPSPPHYLGPPIHVPPYNQPPTKPPTYTTLALGEEGGGSYLL